MRSRLLLAALLLACVTSRGALAQGQASRLELFVQGGGSFLTGHERQPPFAATARLGSISLAPGAMSSFLDSGRLFLGLRYRITANNAFEASFSKSYNRVLVTQATETACSGTGTVVFSRYLAFDSFNYVRYFSPWGRIRPFATAGLGVATFSGCFASFGVSDLAANFGTGAEIALDRRLSLRFEMRDFVTRLPRPLHGTTHDLVPSLGLVVALRPPEEAPSEFPHLQVFAEAGASFLTNAMTRERVMVGAVGTPFQYRTLVARSSFSEAGRSFVGFRVFLTPNSAVEAAWSYAPNRYVLGQEFQPPLGPKVTFQATQWFNDFSADYVRYLPSHGRLEPFLAAGLGLARYSGITEDINKFSVNFGAGTDVRLNRLLALRFEFRDFTAGQPDPIKGVTHNLAPTAGLVFNFQ